jgi:hypothetical protein
MGNKASTQAQKSDKVIGVFDSLQVRPSSTSVVTPKPPTLSTTASPLLGGVPASRAALPGSSTYAGNDLPSGDRHNTIHPEDVAAKMLTTMHSSVAGTDENDIRRATEDYKEVLATVVAHTFAPASDFLKVVVTGVIAAKLAETEMLDFLMPHTEEQLRSWQAMDKVDFFPRVHDLTSGEAAKIRDAYLALNEVKTQEGKHAAAQLDLPMGAALPKYKVFLSFFRRCRQAYSDMRYMNPRADKEDVKKLMYEKFANAENRQIFDKTMDALKKRYKKAHSKRKMEAIRKIKTQQEEEQKKRAKPQEEQLGTQFPEALAEEEIGTWFPEALADLRERCNTANATHNRREEAIGRRRRNYGQANLRVSKQASAAT